MTNFIIDNDGTEITLDRVGSLVGFEYPDINIVSTDIPGRSGVFFIKSDYGRRNLSFQALLDSGVTARRDISSLNSNSLKTLKFTTCDNLSLQTEIAIKRISMPYSEQRSIALVEAFAPDYRFYSQTLTDVDTAPTVSTGGVTLPTSLPIDFSNVTGVPKLTLTNNGDEPSPPNFVITGPGTNFTIQNVTSGGILQINTTITANETIEIDTLNRTILLNGSTNYFGYKSGNFWDVPSGTSYLNFRVQSGSNSDTMLNVQYRSAYKGI